MKTTYALLVLFALPVALAAQVAYSSEQEIESNAMYMAAGLLLIFLSIYFFISVFRKPPGGDDGSNEIQVW